MLRERLGVSGETAFERYCASAPGGLKIHTLADAFVR